MSSNRPAGRPSGGGQPTSRRSARQQRLASREANRNLARASTRGSTDNRGILLLYSGVAVVIALVVIVAAFIVTSQKSGGNGPLSAPNPPLPSVAIPAGVAESGRTLGDPNAKVTIDIYEDFQCPNCWTFTNTVEPQLVANYVATGKAKLTYHDFIVIDSNTGGTESRDAANAALCANDQGKFWPYHDWLFANQYTEGSGAFTNDRLKSIAAAMGGLDLAKFNSCVDNGSHNTDVAGEKGPTGNQGTPSIVINGTLTATYDYATVAAAIDTAAGTTPSPSPTASATAAPTATPTAAPTATPTTAASASPS